MLKASEALFNCVFLTSVCPEPCTGSGIETVLSQGLLDDLINGRKSCRAEQSAGKGVKMGVGWCWEAALGEPDGNVCSGAPRDLL